MYMKYFIFVSLLATLLFSSHEISAKLSPVEEKLQPLFELQLEGIKEISKEIAPVYPDQAQELMHRVYILQSIFYAIR